MSKTLPLPAGWYLFPLYELTQIQTHAHLWYICYTFLTFVSWRHKCVRASSRLQNGCFIVYKFYDETNEYFNIIGISLSLLSDRLSPQSTTNNFSPSNCIRQRKEVIPRRTSWTRKKRILVAWASTKESAGTRQRGIGNHLGPARVTELISWRSRPLPYSEFLLTLDYYFYR